MNEHVYFISNSEFSGFLLKERLERTLVVVDDFENVFFSLWSIPILRWKYDAMVQLNFYGVLDSNSIFKYEQ